MFSTELDKDTKHNTWSKSIKPCIVLLVTSLFFFFEFGAGNIFDALQPSIVHAYHLTPLTIGFIGSLYFYSNIIFLVPAASLLDRYSPRVLVTLALSVCALSFVIIANSTSLSVLMVGRFVMGIGGAFSFVGCMRIATNWFEAKHMARAASAIVTMGMLGGFAAHAPIAFSIEHYGWRGTLVITAAMGITMAMMVLLIVRDSPKEKANDHTERRSSVKAMGYINSVTLAFSNAQNWLCGIYTCCLNIPIMMLGALWGVPYLMHVHHLPLTYAAVIAGMIFIGTMVGAPCFGWLSDRLQRRKVLMVIGAIATIILSLALILIHNIDYTSLVVIFFALGFVSSTQTLSYAIVSQINTRKITSTAISIISMMCMLSAVISEPLFGFILSIGKAPVIQYGHAIYSALQYQHAIEIMPLVTVLGLIVVFFIKEPALKQLVD